MQSVMLTKESLRRPNFTPDEFFNSDTVYRLNNDANPNNDIKNYPGQEQAVLPALMSTADMLQKMHGILLLEFLRRQKAGLIAASVKFFIKINSAYRCLELNRLIGSSDGSQHVQGLAADISSSFGTPEEIMKYLFSVKFPADQCFCEGSWLHYSCMMNQEKNRMMYGYYLPNSKGVRKFKAI
jgi:hypothetical protein